MTALKKAAALMLSAAVMTCAASCGSVDTVGSPKEFALAHAAGAAYAISGADYPDPHAAAAAVRAGIDITGKTVVVKAMEPTRDNVIFDDPDSELSCHVKVTLTYDEKLEDPDLSGIGEGTNDMPVNAVYLFSSEFLVC